ncbi:GNAT family N-acetyltransferase [Segetibacter koreensis]|uniref:GNAT family N-acetyltransferase n=1 Tax=Segetibacter koreensis TaxID=398037 RepID=UPI00035DDF40|nr:GNAT family N-acetyltransferase [Segetibacter koreensis]
MSLYTLSASNKLPEVKIPTGLTVEENTNPLFLSDLCDITIEEAHNRLANNNLAFVAYINDEPAAFGWIALGKAKIGELNHEFAMPQNYGYLWNFRTLVAYRGLGIYPALLQYIIKYHKPQTSHFWIIHAPENKSSLRGIIKAGFTYVGNLYLGKTMQPELKLDEQSKFDEEALKAMGFYKSDDEASSCWNCSSPYLKKRIMECCCSNQAEECKNYNLPAFI